MYDGCTVYCTYGAEYIVAMETHSKPWIRPKKTACAVCSWQSQPIGLKLFYYS